MKTKISLASFCLVLLSAHFSRMNFPLILSIIVLLTPLLFFYKKKISIIIMQIFLVIGTLEWMRATVYYIQQRIDLGIPWLRLAIILCLIIIITGYSAWILNSSNIKKKYL